VTFPEAVFRELVVKVELVEPFIVTRELRETRGVYHPQLSTLAANFDGSSAVRDES